MKLAFFRFFFYFSA
ncbi:MULTISPECIES: pheST operon leader peptide PheM [Xenorhabdus]|nr:pheST operon leader peptide PheM [Xenorhabdus lircayensis]